MSKFSEGPRTGLTEADILDVVGLEFGYNHGDMAGEIIKLRRKVEKLQDSLKKQRKVLDVAVGYRVATAEETKADQDRV